MKTPKCKKDRQRLMGLANYYRKFIKNFSRIAKPINRLLKDDEPWIWGTDQADAVETIKKLLIGSKVLKRPDFTKPFILQTDFCCTGLGAVLSQKDREGKEHPVAYASRSLTTAKQNYAATEGECLAVVWAVEKFRTYLLDKPFELQTDHNALTSLRTSDRLSPKLNRWSMILQQYQYEITYRKGKNNGNADGLSRLTQQHQAILPSFLAVGKAKRIEDPWQDRELLTIVKEGYQNKEWKNTSKREKKNPSEILTEEITMGARRTLDVKEREMGCGNQTRRKRSNDEGGAREGSLQ